MHWFAVFVNCTKIILFLFFLYFMLIKLNKLLKKSYQTTYS